MNVLKIHNLIFSNISLSCYLIFNQLLRFFFLLRRSSGSARIHALIFTCDRPFQLNSLLSSLDDNLFPSTVLHVVCKCSSPVIQQHYEAIRNKYISTNTHEIDFIYEVKSFKASVIKALLACFSRNASHVLFMVDDQIMFRKTDLQNIHQSLKNYHLGTFRFGLNTEYSFNLSKNQYLNDYSPNRSGCIVSWIPTFAYDEISYVFSLDSTMFPLSIALLFSFLMQFKGPNSLESAMNYSSLLYKVLRLRLFSLQYQTCVNIPFNLVQTETSNNHLDFSNEELLDLYLKGKRVVIPEDKVHLINSPHTSSFYSIIS